MTPGPTWHPVDWSIVGPALLAGLLVLATHVPLGRHVLRKGIVFMDLAVAQIAGLGVVLASALGLDPHGWELQACAAGAALAGAGALLAMERHWPDVQEALIGVLFVLASSTAILLLANHPHGGEHLKDLLVGQILWVSTAQLQAMAALTALLLLAWWRLPTRWRRGGFYVVFALAVTASVQLVGVYLVFSSLILPALAVRHLASSGRGLAWAYGLGGLAYGLGLTLSAMFDLPSGALIVVCMAGICLIGARPRP